MNIKSLKYTIILFIFFLSNTCFSQWYSWSTVNSPTSISLTTVETTENESIYIGGPGLSGPYFSDDHTLTWDLRPINASIKDMQHLKYSNGTGDDIMTAYNSSQQMHTSYGWNNTSTSPLISNFYPSNYYTTAQWFNYSSFLCAKAGGVLYYKSSNFSTQTIIPSSPTNLSNVNDIYFIDSTAWIVTQGGDIYKFNENEDLIAEQIYNGNTALNSVYFITNNIGYCSGDNGLILSTKNAGLTWHSTNTLNSINLNKIIFRDKDKGIIVGDDGIIVSTADGEHWQEEIFSTNVNLKDVAFINDTLIIAVGQYGTILLGNRLGLDDEHKIYDKRANNWVLGDNCNISFNANNTISNGALSLASSSSISSCLSDTIGNIRYYTDGREIWDNQNILVPGGSGLVGGLGCGGYFRTMMVDHPKLPNKVFVFYTAKEVHQGTTDTLIGFYLTIVNDTLNNGGPGIELLNELIFETPSLTLSSVNHANSRDVWILILNAKKYEVRAYLLTCNGLNPNPVISNLPKIGSPNSSYGQIKPSPRGDKIVLSRYQKLGRYIQLFDFDNATGKLTNSKKIDSHENYYTTYPIVTFNSEFSSDGNKLIINKTITSSVLGDHIATYSANENSVENTLLSEKITEIEWNKSVSVPQIGPDSKIYFGHNYGLSSIQQPNQDSCNSEFHYIALDSLYGHRFTPYTLFNQSIFYKPNIRHTKIKCGNLPIKFWLTRPNYPVQIDSLQWKFGGQTSNNNTSALFEPEHLFNTKGKNSVSCVRYFNNGYSDTSRITINIPNLKFELADTIALQGDSTNLNADVVYYSNFEWSTGQVVPSIYVTESGWYHLTLYDCICGSYTDSILVIDPDAPDIFNVVFPNVFTPNGDNHNNLYHLNFIEPYNKKWTMTIHNRWGETVHILNENNLTWDGSNLNGEACSDGVYFYTFKTLLNARIFNKSGNITLIR